MRNIQTCAGSAGIYELAPGSAGICELAPGSAGICELAPAGTYVFRTKYMSLRRWSGVSGLCAGSANIRDCADSAGICELAPAGIYAFRTKYADLRWASVIVKALEKARHFVAAPFFIRSGVVAPLVITIRLNS